MDSNFWPAILGSKCCSGQVQFGDVTHHSCSSLRWPAVRDRAGQMCSSSASYVWEGLFQQSQESLLTHLLYPYSQHLFGALQHGHMSLQPVACHTPFAFFYTFYTCFQHLSVTTVISQDSGCGQCMQGHTILCVISARLRAYDAHGNKYMVCTL